MKASHTWVKVSLSRVVTIFHNKLLQFKQRFSIVSSDHLNLKVVRNYRIYSLILQSLSSLQTIRTINLKFAWLLLIFLQNEVIGLPHHRVLRRCPTCNFWKLSRKHCQITKYCKIYGNNHRGKNTLRTKLNVMGSRHFSWMNKLNLSKQIKKQKII